MNDKIAEARQAMDDFFKDGLNFEIGPGPSDLKITDSEGRELPGSAHVCDVKVFAPTDAPTRITLTCHPRSVLIKGVMAKDLQLNIHEHPEKHPSGGGGA